jgi:hypothetical protein
MVNQSSRARSEEGFTLLELTVTAGLVALASGALLHLFATCLWQAEGAGYLTTAAYEAHAKVEEIRATNFDALTATYGPGGTLGDTFPMVVPEGMGKIYLTAVNADLMQVEVAVSWRDRGTVVGEDKNLNGTLDGAEDGNFNGLLDSPASAVTLIAR